MRCRTCWFRMVSSTRLWWKPDSQLQTGVPSMRMWSFLTPPPGRGSSWKYQSSQSGPTLHWDAARAGLDGVNAQLRAREEDKRNHRIIHRLFKGKSTIFTPIVLSACGAMGPSRVVAFLKEVYGRAKDPVSAYLVPLPRPGRSDLRSAYPPLRRRYDACPHARDG